LRTDERRSTSWTSFVPIGVEARVLTNGKLLDARTFPTGDDALRWAEEERTERHHLSELP